MHRARPDNLQPASGGGWLFGRAPGSRHCRLGLLLVVGIAPGIAGAAQIALGPEPPRWGPARPEAEIGEPVDWVLEIVHARRGRPDIVSENLEERLGASWAFLSGPVILTRADEREPGVSDRERSTFTWKLMALEAGERSAPALLLQADSGEQLEVLSDELLIKPALADGEDGPRPFAQFHEVEGGTVGSLTKLFGILIGSLLLLVIAGVWLVRRARRRLGTDAPLVPISPRAAFDALVSSRSDDGAGVQRLAFELTGILRHALSVGEAGATDQEWLDAARGETSLAPEQLARAEAVLSACEQIKYGGQVPTRFAIDEMLANVDTILRELDRVQAGAANLEAVG